MNRKERRRAGIKVPAKSYTMTDEQISKITEEARQQGIGESTVIVLYVSLLTLRDSGFGKKRLTEFTEEWFELLDSVQEGYLDFKDMIDTIKEETGFEIEI